MASKAKLKLFQILLQLLAPFYRITHPIRKDGRKRLLLIRNDAVGDFIEFLIPALTLRKCCPPEQYNISIFVAPDLADWAKDSRLFDEVFVIRKTSDRLNFREEMSQYLLLHNIPADVLFNTLHGRNGTTDLLALASPAKKKYAFSLDQWPHPEKQILHDYEAVYDRTVPLPREQSLIDSCRALFSLAVTFPKTLRKPDSADLDFLCAESFDLPDSPYCVIVPGAASKSRQWEPEKFADVATWIREHFGFRIVITGTAQEQPLAERIAKTVPVLDLCGKLNLKELAFLLSNASLCISNETGSVHVASIFDVPSFCILSGQHFGLYVPCPYRKKLIAIYRKHPCFSCNGFCTKDPASTPFPCISEISANEVIRHIENDFTTSHAGDLP